MSVLKIRNKDGNWVGVPSIKGEPGADGYTPIRGTDYWTAADIEAINTANQGYINEKVSEKTELKPEFAETIAECIDETKLYVLPDGYVYAHYTKYIEEVPNFVNGADLNKKLTSSGELSSNPADGCLTTDWVSMTWNDWDNNDYQIKIKAPALYNNGTNSSAIYFFFSNSADVSGKIRVAAFETTSSYLSYSEDEGVYTLNISKQIFGQSTTPKYCKFTVCLSETPLTEENLIGVSIECPNENISEEQLGWHNTGHAFIPQRGRDYWTEEDKAAIVAEVIAAVLDAMGSGSTDNTEPV